MNPETILQTIKALAEAFAQGFLYLQTPAGQKAMEKALEDQQAFRSAVAGLGTWIGKLVTGKL